MNDIAWNVVIASSDLEHRRRIATILTNLGLDPILVSRVCQCRELVQKGNVGLVFCDQFLKDGDYREIAAICGSAPARPCVVVTLPSSEDNDNMREDVFGLVRTPVRPTEIEWMVIRAKRNHRLQRASEAAEVGIPITPFARSG